MRYTLWELPNLKLKLHPMFCIGYVEVLGGDKLSDLALEIKSSIANGNKVKVTDGLRDKIITQKELVTILKL